MGKKRQQFDWREAKKLCRLNQNDIAIAKALGFQPGALIRARPDPKQKWKQPVKYWIRDLHFMRFGHVLGEKQMTPPPPEKLEYDEEATRIYGEQLYWEDYWERNQDSRAGKQQPAEQQRPSTPVDRVVVDALTDDDVPF